MVELVSILSEEICVGLAAGAWCDESEIIFAGLEDILKSLVACYRTRSFLSRVSSVFVGIVKASNWSAHSGVFGRIRERAEDQTCMKTSKHWLVFWGNCFRHQGRKKSLWKDKNIIMPWNWYLLSTQIYHFFFFRNQPSRLIQQHQPVILVASFVSVRQHLHWVYLKIMRCHR